MTTATEYDLPSRSALQNNVHPPLAPPTLTLADFPHLKNDCGWIVAYLRDVVKARKTGVHILMAGPSGTGKGQFARLLVQATGLCAFELGPNNSADDYYSAQGILQTHPGVIMVFKGAGTAAKYCDRLDSCATPTIWISNKTSSMDDSILRRLAFQLELHQPKYGQSPKESST